MKTLDIDIKKLAVLLLPTFLRKPLLQALVGSTTRALQQTHINFGKYRTDVDYRRNHNGQVCYLQAALNDTLDSESRRIKITDTHRTVPVLFYPEQAEKPVVFSKEIPTLAHPVLFGRESLFGENKQDFEVSVPIDIFVVGQNSYSRLPNEIIARNILNRYKLAGKRYILKNT